MYCEFSGIQLLVVAKYMAANCAWRACRVELESQGGQLHVRDMAAARNEGASLMLAVFRPTIRPGFITVVCSGKTYHYTGIKFFLLYMGLRGLRLPEYAGNYYCQRCYHHAKLTRLMTKVPVLIDCFGVIAPGDRQVSGSCGCLLPPWCFVFGRVEF
jgi:hypothetical protein